MSPAPRQHGVKGVYYGGDWLDIEDCDGKFTGIEDSCSGCPSAGACPRSRSRNSQKPGDAACDVVIIGAGCIGAAIARELSRYQVDVMWLEAGDDVSQGATKGNSGIVHAGYDDTPGSVRAKYCWPGNQLFAQLDKELRFGYQRNGSLVIALNKKEMEHLDELKKRGETNGVKNLRIVNQKELREMEPEINPAAVGALYSPDAGNVIPYEFAIALAENAVDNGVELRIRRQVTAIGITEKHNLFEVKVRYWEPASYVDALSKGNLLQHALTVASALVMAHYLLSAIFGWPHGKFHIATIAVLIGLTQSDLLPKVNMRASRNIEKLVADAGQPEGKGGRTVKVDDMFIGGSGSTRIQEGLPVKEEKIYARYVVNCAGGASDKIARMIGDDSFTIKPRLGDYILLNRNQGHLAKHTIFPCPDPVLGKGVLVQTTLWGNLILGPTARDTYKPEARDMSPAEIQRYILAKCKQLVASFDPKETIHAFCGARAKSDRGDWIIEPSKVNANVLHVAGIDSPGLAGAPAIALDVVKMLKKAGLELKKDPSFNPNRAPIITPKSGMKGLKMGPVGKNDGNGTDEKQMAANVICKCEKVTELEVVRAMRRSLPIDSSQAIRKRTRAGMGHCQGDPENYNCEARVRAIIARENGVPVDQVGGRPWPATSTLAERWIGDDEKEALAERAK